MSESVLCAKCGHTITNDIELPTTPVPDLLGGHYIASESQAPMICDTISVAQADILQLDGEITRLNAVLDGLTRKRDTLQKYTHLHTALVAPIRRLPPEVLSEIFLHCNDENNIPHLQLNQAPLLLGGLCSRWRTIALSTTVVDYVCAYHSAEVFEVRCDAGKDLACPRRYMSFDHPPCKSRNLPKSHEVAHEGVPAPL